MKKTIFTIILALSCFFMTSCVSTVEAQDDMYSVSTIVEANDIEMAITYGTPFIVDDMVYYYYYNNLYYYPFYTRGYWYYRVYTTPLYRYPRYWRPAPRSYWFVNGRYHNPHGFVGHHHHGPADRHHGVRPGRDRSYQGKPVVRHPGQAVGGSRPSSARETVRNNNNRVMPNNRTITPNNRVVSPSTRGSVAPRTSVSHSRGIQSQPRGSFGGSRSVSPSMRGGATRGGTGRR